MSRTSAVLAALVAASATLYGLAAAPAAQAAPAPAAGPEQAVIAVLRDQHPDLAPKVQTEQRRAAITRDQSPVLGELAAHHATGVVGLTTVNAVAAKVGPDGLDALLADPAIAAVVPDRAISLPRTAATAPAAPGTGAPAAGRNTSPLCPADPAKPLLEPEALQVTHTESTDPAADQAHSLATGKGVKIALVADGVDVNNPDYLRPDGSHVIFDFQDFSGDGTNDDSGGGEAFGDASSLAAQGRSTFDFADQLPNAGLAPGCTFRIRGMAPDASVAAIKVFGEFGTTESAFVRGIDYAVEHDKVDVLSESFGGNPFPDTALDPVALADEAAVRAGVTVVASSGDSGVSGTVGSPASDPLVIAAGATDTYRLIALAKGYQGFTSNNITALSSGGATQQGRVVDLVAPGSAGMADCTVAPQWGDCTHPTEPFGGTSQSAPLIAGAAAMVIQAYAATHGGAHPSPDLVKRLLAGTATDLSSPADQQGSGLLNSAAAVRAAMAVPADGATAAGRQASGTSGLLPDRDQLDLIGHAGLPQLAAVTLTNTGNRPQVVTETSRQLGGQVFAADRSVRIGAAATAAAAVTGVPSGPGEEPLAAAPQTFEVPAGLQWMNGEMIWPGARTTGQLCLELFDPAGRLVQVSYDFGFTNFQQIGVADPAPGTWTAKVLWSNGRNHLQEPRATPGTFTGTVDVHVAGFRYTPAGVPPRLRVIPPGGSARFDVAVPMPGQAGDFPMSLQFDSDTGSHLSLPVARRVLIPTGGPFTATVTGGVGRGLNQYLSFFTDVPPGRPDMTVDLHTPDPATRLQFFLVSPSRQVLSGDTNAVTAAFGGPGATPTGTASMTVDRPESGRWQLIVLQVANSSGLAFAEQVTGSVRFGAVDVRAAGLPDDPHVRIAPGSPRTATVTVHNTGAAGEFVFADPRQAGQATVTLPPFTGRSHIDLPADTAATREPSWLVPPHTTALQETVHATLPVDADLFFTDGNPEVFGRAGAGNTTTVGVRAPQLAFGRWATDIGEVGPFAGTAAPGSADITMAARTAAFDPSVSSSTGDFWATATGGPAAAPVFVPAGGTATITVTVAAGGPSGTVVAGTVVAGTLFVDTFNTLDGQGSELTGIPYRFTAG